MNSSPPRQGPRLVGSSGIRGSVARDRAGDVRILVLLGRGARLAPRDGPDRAPVVSVYHRRACRHFDHRHQRWRARDRRGKDRRTLDFLLLTRLANAEIVLAKFAARFALLLAIFAAGVPVMLLLDLLGGIDLRVILLAYGAIATTSFLGLAIAIASSTFAPTGRRATAGRSCASSPG